MKNSNIAVLAMTFVFSMCSAFSVAHAARPGRRPETKLVIPYFVSKDGLTQMSIAELNKDLKRRGLAELPLSVEVSNRTSGKKVYELFAHIQTEIENSMRALGPDWHDGTVMNERFPGEYSAKAGPRTCYIGDASGVANLAASMAGVYYSEQLNVFGWKYKKKRGAVESAGEPEDVFEFLERNLPLWKNWKGFDDTVLLVSAVSDDGDDMNPSLIPVCE